MGLGIPLPPTQTLQPLTEMLRATYAQQMSESGIDPYLKAHASSRFIAGQVKVFEWYRSYLPAEGQLLDWGCRHAPDSCLIKHAYGTRYSQHACDLPPKGQYGVFHRVAGVDYRQLTDVVQLPYDSNQFDGVIGSGVLEHVAMDYESLKELYRILKVNGRLIITFLPNRLSYGEWQMRRKGQVAHRRLYSPRLIRELLLRSGFYPMQWGYQTQLDQLPAQTPVMKFARPLVKTLQLHRVLSSCLCVIAKKVDCM